MADRDVLDVKLESLNRCLDRIVEKTPSSVDQLLEDYDVQDIIAVNLQRAVQVCVDIGTYLISDRGWSSPGTMAETFSTLADHGILGGDIAEQMRRTVGFRNISVHEYDEIDWSRVFSIITEHLSDFRTYAANIVDHWDD